MQNSLNSLVMDLYKENLNISEISNITEYNENEIKKILNLHSLKARFDNHAFYLRRLNEKEFKKYFFNSVYILPDFNFYSNFKKSMINSDTYMKLSEFHAILKYMYGKSNDLYDMFLGTFSYPFLIKFKKDRKILTYILEITDLKDQVMFFYRKVIPHNKIKDIHNRDLPFKNELNYEDMNSLISYLYGYFLGKLQKYKNRLKKENFIKFPNGYPFLYGCINEKFFEKSYETFSHFQVDKTKYLDILEKSV